LCRVGFMGSCLAHSKEVSISSLAFIASENAVVEKVVNYQDV
jgi:hypothetical protein